MPDDVIKETNRQIVFYPRILKRRGGKVALLRKGWMVEVCVSTRGIPPCYLLMIPTNPHPLTHNKQHAKTKIDRYKSTEKLPWDMRRAQCRN